MPLTAEQDEVASAAALAAGALLEDLEAGNAIRSSPIRVELTETLTDLVTQLDDSMTHEDGSAVDRIVGAIKTYDDVRDSLQAMAEIEWTELYAHFLDQLRDLVENRDPMRVTPGQGIPGLLTPQWAIAARWRARTRRTPGTPIPPEVVGRFVFLVRWQIEARLANQLPRVQQLSRLRVLNGDDIPSTWWLASSFTNAADRAIADYQAHQRALRAQKAREEEEPGIVALVWGVVGYDSFADFAFDVGLIVVTGGAGVAIRWAKRLNKAIRIKREIGTARKVRRLTSLYEGELKRAGEAQLSAARRIERNTARVVSSGKKYGELVDELRNLSLRLVRSEEASAQIIGVLEEARPLIQRIYVDAAGERAQRAIDPLLPGDRKEKTIGESIESETRKALIERTAAFELFGAEVERARDRFLRLLPLDTKARERAFVRWFLLLLARQFAIEVAVVLMAKRQLDEKALSTSLIKAFGAAVETALIDLRVPKPVAESVERQLISAVRKTLVGVVDRVVKVVVQTI